MSPLEAKSARACVSVDLVYAFCTVQAVVMAQTVIGIDFTVVTMVACYAGALVAVDLVNARSTIQTLGVPNAVIDV